jgi:hypothetical protein
MLLRPFRAWHAGWLEDKGFPAGGWLRLSPEQIQIIERHPSWTVIGDEGEPIACGGCVQIWPGRYSAWAYLNEATGPHMLAITRYALECLATVKGRLEMTVRTDFEAGHRWARILGFTVETPVMPFYGPEGEAHSMYVRIN